MTDFTFMVKVCMCAGGWVGGCVCGWEGACMLGDGWEGAYLSHQITGVSPSSVS